MKKTLHRLFLAAVLAAVSFCATAATYNLTSGAAPVSQVLSPGITSIVVKNGGPATVALAFGQVGVQAIDTDPRIPPGASVTVNVPLGASAFSVVTIERGPAVPVVVVENAIDPRALQVSSTPVLPYASLPPASGANGVEAYASDLGANGTRVRSNAARWRPVNGVTTLKDLGAPSGAIANTETIVLQTLIPINAWQTNDTIRLWFTVTKSGATDVLQTSVRVGTAGTTGDTAITGLSAFNTLAASNTSGGFFFDIKLVSATSAQKVGVNATFNGSYAGAQNLGAAAATTITDASANALYVSLTIRSSGATDTVAIQGGQIELRTP